jgi:hypothetical protein
MATRATVLRLVPLSRAVARTPTPSQSAATISVCFDFGRLFMGPWLWIGPKRDSGKTALLKFRSAGVNRWPATPKARGGFNAASYTVV